MALANNSRESLAYMLEHCKGFMRELSQWEQGFIESVNERFERGGELTEKQIDRLEQIYCKLP